MNWITPRFHRKYISGKQARKLKARYEARVQYISDDEAQDLKARYEARKLRNDEFDNPGMYDRPFVLDNYWGGKWHCPSCGLPLMKT